MDEWLEQVAAIRANRISKKSREVYISSNVRFIIWVHQHLPQILDRAFLQALNRLPRITKKGVRALLLERSIPPLKFEEITIDHFMAWIASLKQTGGWFPAPLRIARIGPPFQPFPKLPKVNVSNSRNSIIWKLYNSETLCLLKAMVRKDSGRMDLLTTLHALESFVEITGREHGYGWDESNGSHGRSPVECIRTSSCVISGSSQPTCSWRSIAYCSSPCLGID